MERFLCYFFFHSPHFDFIWSASAHLTVIQNMFTRCPPIDNEHQWCGSKRGFDLRETRQHCRLPIHKLWDHNAVCWKQEILLIKKGKVKREEEHCSSSRGRWSLVFNQSFEKCCQWGEVGVTVVELVVYSCKNSWFHINLLKSAARRDGIVFVEVAHSFSNIIRRTSWIPINLLKSAAKRDGIAVVEFCTSYSFSNV